jgi:uncharacterized protein YjbI with pentapeptide repeats
MKRLTRADVERIVKEAREKGERPDLSDTDLSQVGLSRANLSEADLKGTDLSRTNLNGADLYGANLSRARLSGADLYGADLSGADLDGADLDEANLKRANLTTTNFFGADLYGADLSEAELYGADLDKAKLNRTNLSRADLIGADLDGADLDGADLNRANLSRANLSEANLNNTNLNRADLNRADLNRAILWNTIFASVDLSAVKGLDTVIHNGPSHIDTHTLTRSKGKIPIKFLRGCGLSDHQIEMSKLEDPTLSADQIIDTTYKISNLLTGDAIKYHSCFISYSHKDEDFAQQLYDGLQESGVRCWYAPEDMKGGDKLYPQIDQAIGLHDKLLLVLSEQSLQSEWVTTEIRRARKMEFKEKQRKLFPIRLMDMHVLTEWKCFDADTGKDLAVEVREYFIPDFSKWKKDHDAYQTSFERLLRDLKAEEGQ